MQRNMGCGPGGGTHGGDVKLINNPVMGNQNAYRVESVMTGGGLFFRHLSHGHTQKCSVTENSPKVKASNAQDVAHL